MTASQEPRHNRLGHPCPPWCVVDHEKYEFHGGAIAGVEMPGKMRSMPDVIRARPVQLGERGYPPAVSVSGTRRGRGGDGDPDMWLGVRDALNLAGLVEMLAAATPARHRELAAAIRKAAAGIADGGQP
jgi:hypothetical protein